MNAPFEINIRFIRDEAGEIVGWRRLDQIGVELHPQLIAALTMLFGSEQ